MALLTLGTVVWFPYLYLKYGSEQTVSSLPFLAIHVPCMAGALAIRIWQWRKKRVG